MATGFTYVLNYPTTPAPPIGITGSSGYTPGQPQAPTGGNWINWNINANTIIPAGVSGYTGDAGTLAFPGNLTVQGTLTIAGNNTALYNQLLLLATGGTGPSTGVTGSVSDKIILAYGTTGTYPVSIGNSGSTLYQSVPAGGAFASYIGGTGVFALTTNTVAIGANTSAASIFGPTGSVTIGNAAGSATGTVAIGQGAATQNMGAYAVALGAAAGGFTGTSTTVAASSGPFAGVTGVTGGLGAYAVAIGANTSYQNDSLYGPPTLSTSFFPATSTFAVPAITSSTAIMMPISVTGASAGAGAFAVSANAGQTFATYLATGTTGGFSTTVGYTSSTPQFTPQNGYTLSTTTPTTFSASDTIQAAVSSGNVYLSTNLGAAYTLNNPSVGTPGGTFTCIYAGTALVAVGTSTGRIYTYTLATSSWNTATITVSLGSITSINVSGTNITAIDVYGNIMTSTNSGASFAILPLAIQQVMLNLPNLTSFLSLNNSLIDNNGLTYGLSGAASYSLGKYGNGLTADTTTLSLTAAQFNAITSNAFSLIFSVNSPNFNINITYTTSTSIIITMIFTNTFCSIDYNGSTTFTWYPPNNTWFTVTLLFNTNGISVYQNGTPVGTLTITTPNYIASTPFQIKRILSSSIQNVAFYNTILSPSQIATIASPFTSGNAEVSSTTLLPSFYNTFGTFVYTLPIAASGTYAQPNAISTTLSGSGYVTSSAISSTGTYQLLLMSTGSVYLSSSSGTSFALITVGASAANTAGMVTMSTNGQYMMVFFTASIPVAYSTNFGVSWSTFTTPLIPSTPISVVYSSSGTYAFTQTATILYGGKIASTLQTYLALNSSAAYPYYGVGATPNALVWSPITIGAPATAASSIATNTTFTTFLYATGNSTTSGSIYYSLNSTILSVPTFTQLTSQISTPTGFVSSIAMSANGVYAGMTIATAASGQSGNSSFYYTTNANAGIGSLVFTTINGVPGLTNVPINWSTCAISGTAQYVMIANTVGNVYLANAGSGASCTVAFLNGQTSGINNFAELQQVSATVRWLTSGMSTSGQYMMLASANSLIVSYNFGVNWTTNMLENTTVNLAMVLNSYTITSAALSPDGSLLVVTGTTASASASALFYTLQQTTNTVAIGASAAALDMGNSSVALGAGAGASVAGYNAVMMGTNAGQTNMPANSVALGWNAAAESDPFIYGAPTSISLTTVGAFPSSTLTNTGSFSSFGATVASNGQYIVVPSANDNMYYTSSNAGASWSGVAMITYVNTGIALISGYTAGGGAPKYLYTGYSGPPLYIYNPISPGGFTAINSTNNLGPTSLIDYSPTTYPWVTNYLSLSSTGIQVWIVPQTGTYQLIAAGASGVSNGLTGGWGACITSSVTLQKGAIIYILVGNTPVSNYAGGGGTFIVQYNGGSTTSSSSYTPLLIAGGGGGGINNSAVTNATNNGTSGKNGDGIGFGTGGTSGGAGGAGISQSGAGYLAVGSSSTGNVTVSQSFLLGGVGGNNSNYGGFGSGGAGYSSSGGGGGGYSGGGAGGTNGNGGGGGSYDSTNTYTPSTGNYPATSGYNEYAGFAKITFTSTTYPVCFYTVGTSSPTYLTITTIPTSNSLSTSACANLSFTNLLVCTGNGSGTIGKVYWAYNSNPASTSVPPVFSVLTNQNGSIFASFFNYNQCAMSTATGKYSVITYNNNTNLSQLWYSSNTNLTTNTPSLNGLSFTAITPSAVNNLPSLTTVTATSGFWSAVAISTTGTYILAAVNGGGAYLSANGNAAGGVSAIVFSSITALPAVAAWSWAGMSASGQYMVLSTYTPATQSGTLVVTYNYGVTWAPLNLPAGFTNSLGLRPSMAAVDASKIVIVGNNGVVTNYTLSVNLAGNSVAVGALAGTMNQGGNSVAVGGSAGTIAQGVSSVAIGAGAATTLQGASAVAIGYGAGASAQGVASIAIGVGAAAIGATGTTIITDPFTGIGGYISASGSTGGTPYTGAFGGVAVGFQAAQYAQNPYAISIGPGAGQTNQGAGAIAIGFGAAQGPTGGVAVSSNFAFNNALGNVYGAYTGFTGWTGYTGGQGAGGVAIGTYAGYENDYALAYGAPIAQTALNTIYSYSMPGISQNGNVIVTSNTVTNQYYLSTNAGTTFSLVTVASTYGTSFSSCYMNAAGTVGLMLPAIPTGLCFYSINLNTASPTYSAITLASSYQNVYAATTLSLNYIIVAPGNNALGTTSINWYWAYNAAPASSAPSFITIASGISPSVGLPNTASAWGQIGMSSLTGQYVMMTYSSATFGISGNSTLYYSTNNTSISASTIGGLSFATVTGVPSYTGSTINWCSCAMSGTGQYILAGNTSGAVYLSTSGGAGSTAASLVFVLVPINIGTNATSATMSISGQYMAHGSYIASNLPSTVYVSYNYGISWSILPNYGMMGGAYPTMSGNGNVLIVVTKGGAAFGPQVLVYSLTANTGNVAIGTSAGTLNALGNTVAIGFQAGAYNMGTGAVAIGYNAGQSNLGAGSIAIGSGAGADNSGVVYAAPAAYATGLSNIPTGFGVSQNGQYITAIAYSASTYNISVSTNGGPMTVATSQPTLTGSLVLMSANGVYQLTLTFSTNSTYYYSSNGTAGVAITFTIIPTNLTGGIQGSVYPGTCGAMSSDGKYIIIGNSYALSSSPTNYLYYSTTGGTASLPVFTVIGGGSTGIPAAAVTNYWSMASMSSNAQYIIIPFCNASNVSSGFATTHNLYYSTNGGSLSTVGTITFTPLLNYTTNGLPQTPLNSNYYWFRGSAMSSNGQYILVIVGPNVTSNAAGGVAYLSINGGALSTPATLVFSSVTFPNNSSSYYFTSCAMSNSGQYMMVSGVTLSPFYVSYNYGSSWVLFTLPNVSSYANVMSGDGTKMVFSANTGSNILVYTLVANASINSVAIGNSAGAYNQGPGAIAIGYGAGQTMQGLAGAATLASYGSGATYATGLNYTPVGVGVSQNGQYITAITYIANSYNISVSTTGGPMTTAASQPTLTGSLVLMSANGVYQFILPYGTNNNYYYSANGTAGVAITFTIFPINLTGGIQGSVFTGTCCAMSSDGKYIIVGNSYAYTTSPTNYLYYSTTGGTASLPVFTVIGGGSTGIPAAAVTNYWSMASMSSDARYIIIPFCNASNVTTGIATTHNLYYSTNGGASSTVGTITFTPLLNYTTNGLPQTPSNSNYYWFRGSSMSSNGQYILVIVGPYQNNNAAGGVAYLSNNGGALSTPATLVFSSVTFPNNSSSYYFNSCAMSNSGQYMMVSGQNSLFFYVSYSYGSSWVLFTLPSASYSYLANVMSGDGTKMVFSANAGLNILVYTLVITTASTVAIGQFAGQYSQGLNAIAIGYSAGQSAQPIGSFYVGTSVLPASASVGGIILGGLAYSALTGEIFYNTAKTFVIDHPLDPARYLVHACMEGPEEGVYQRGWGSHPPTTDRMEGTVITLESYSDALAYDYTVQVSAIYNEDSEYTKENDMDLSKRMNSLASQAEPRNYSASRVKDGKFTVYGPPGEFSWHVIGKRRGPFDVVVPKQDVVIKGDGPYTYLASP